MVHAPGAVKTCLGIDSRMDTKTWIELNRQVALFRHRELRSAT